MSWDCERMTSVQWIVVRARSRRERRGAVHFGGRSLPCALGRSGRAPRKREGDGASPVGRFTLLRVLYRADRVGRPATGLPVTAIRPCDGWCDAPTDRNYNRAVRLPYPASTESLCRADRLYDIVVVLSHNQLPRVRGAGSAVFIHLARPGYLPTEGCVALSERDMRMLLARMRCGSAIWIRP